MAAILSIKLAQKMSPELTNILRCPGSGSRLTIEQNFLKSGEGQIYPIIDGIPCLLPQDAKSKSTHSGYDGLLNQNAKIFDAGAVDSKALVKNHIREMIVPTCGNLYRGANLHRYPIPIFPEVFPAGETILDIGCNWGRWSFASA